MRRANQALLGAPGLAALVILASMSAVPAPALAQGNDCICTLGGSGGPVGSLTAASGDVFVNGTNGEVAAGIGTLLSAGSELSTGANGTARASFRGGCTVALNGSMSLSVSPTGDGLCVALRDDTLGGGNGGGGGDLSGMIFTSVLLGEGALIVGSGLESPTSK